MADKAETFSRSMRTLLTVGRSSAFAILMCSQYPKLASQIDSVHRMRILDQLVDIDARRAVDTHIYAPRLSLGTFILNVAPADVCGNATGR